MNLNIMKTIKGRKSARTIFLRLGLIFLLGTLVVRCDLNDDSVSGDFDSGLWGSFGLVHRDSSRVDSDFSISLDNGAILFPQNAGSYNMADSARVFVSYNVLDSTDTGNSKQYDVMIYQIQNVLFKTIAELTAANADSIGDDPINVEKYWKVNNIITFELSFWGNSATHFINLVRSPADTAREGQPILLELKHNANDDLQMYQMSAWVSFNLSSLKVAGQDSVSYTLTARQYDGTTYEKKDVFRY